MPKTSDRKHDARFVTINLPVRSLEEVRLKADQHSEALGIVRFRDGFAIRAKREHADRLRAVLLPESAYVEMASFNDDESLYTVSNVPQMARDELGNALRKTGWDATVIKPCGNSRWLVAAKDDPKAAHVAINGVIALVERHQKKQHTGTIMALVSREIKVDTIMDAANNVVQVSATSRFSEIKAHVEAQISQVVEGRMQQANARIEALTGALQELQTQSSQAHDKVVNDITQMKDEQQFTRQKLKEVEGSVAASGTAIISQMQQMFQTMQASLEQTVMQRMTHETDKRPRTEEVPKGDPFATKS